MRLVLVLLATFLQSLFNFRNLQNLIGLYAFNNICRMANFGYCCCIATQAEAEKKTKSTIEILVFTAATTIMVRDPL